jgi:hypothetical protein
VGIFVIDDFPKAQEGPAHATFDRQEKKKPPQREGQGNFVFDLLETYSVAAYSMLSWHRIYL